MHDSLPSTPSYAAVLKNIQERIQTAQVRAAVAVNQELILLYWGIGREILSRQAQEGWGKNVIPCLSRNLASEFPAMKGLSPRNLGYMKAFAETWPEESILQQLVAKLPWSHNVRLLDHVKDSRERQWYAQAAIERGWSRNVLVIQIEAGKGDHELHQCVTGSPIRPGPTDSERPLPFRLPDALQERRWT